MAATDSDEELLRGTPEQFGGFYRRTERPMLAFFMRRTGDPEVAADLAAETFAQALASRHRYRADRAPARAWLWAIAGHVLAASIRRGQVDARARRRLGLEPLALTDERLDRIAELSSLDAVRLALEGLPAEQQAAVRARVLAEEPYSRIAARLECSEAVARQRVSRGLKALRTTLEETR